MTPPGEPPEAVADARPPAGPEPGYSAHRAADVVLSDGGTVHVRPIRASDAAAIVALHARFSERTRYLRYFSAYPRIPARDLRRFTEVDHHDREAFVAVLRDALIAVGRYERLDPESAEVALVVEDAHQGRGLGSVLLEHLAAAAREEGVSRFVAEVLPENGQMIRVFGDAGYVLDRSYDDGVVHLVFDTAETPRLLEVLHDREQRTESRSIRRLLEPRSVAVVGVGRRPGTLGRVLFDHLRAAGPGRVVPVNPHAAEIDGVPCVASVRDLVDPVDLAVLAVPAAAVAGVVDDCAARGVHGLVVVSGGFAETGEDGRRAERRVVEAARASGMRVVGPNCFGLLNTDPAAPLNATLAPGLPRRGRIGFFCQSGELGIAVLAEVDRRGLGLSTFVSAGNRADVSGNDLLQFWRDDPATDVVLLYLETFGNPRKFARLARGLARRKPVVVLRSRTAAGPGGRDPAGGGAVGGGAGGVGGEGPGRDGPDERGLRALYRSAGVVTVDTLGELLDVAQILAGSPLPTGHRVAVVGNSAALGTLAVDACAAAGLEVPDGWVADVGPGATPDALRDAVTAALAAPGRDAVLVVVAPALGTPDDAWTDVLDSVAAGARVPVVATFATGRTTAAGIPTYATPEAAARALGRVADHARWRRAPAGAFRPLPDTAPVVTRARVDALLVAHPDDVEVADGEAADLLAGYGIAVWPGRRATSARDAVAAARAVGYPVAVKAADGALRHRVDLGGVRVDVATPREVRAAYAAIAAVAEVDRPTVLVQPMAPAGVACVVEVAQDAAFGPVVGFGLGGVAAELFADRAWRPAPLTDLDAAALVREPLAAPLLFGYRGARPVDATALEDLVARVGALADDQPGLVSLRLNPVLAGAGGLSVLHATVRLARPVPGPDAGPRRLR